MKRRILILTVGIIIVFFYIARVLYVNQNKLYPTMLEYSMGEEVKIEDDFFDSSCERMNGYSVIVTNTEVMSTNDFKKKYGIENSDMLANSNYVLLIYALFKNTSNTLKEDAGIDLTQYILQESSYINFIERDVYPIVNGFDSLAFSLRLNSEKEIIIPFSIDTYYIDIERIINGNPNLIVSLYPHKKIIELS